MLNSSGKNGVFLVRDVLFRNNIRFSVKRLYFSEFEYLYEILERTTNSKKNSWNREVLV
jgi:hypothetical protein